MRAASIGNAYGLAYRGSFDTSGNFDMSSMPTGTYISIGGVRFYNFTTAITENSTVTTAPAGSYAFTSHTTGKTKIFYSDGSVWQIIAADTGAGTVATADIANDAVTYAKIQNVTATDKLLGRSTSGAGDVEEIACTAAGRALLDDVDAPAQLVTLGITALAAEVNLIDGGVAGTAVASKAAILGSNKNLDVLAVADLKLGAGAGTSVTATAAELNKLAGSGAHVASGTQQSSITDASVAHALNATFSDTEVEGALDALGAKINLVLDALDAYGITL